MKRLGAEDSAVVLLDDDCAGAGSYQYPVSRLVSLLFILTYQSSERYWLRMGASAVEASE
jgi:hypothetical protein